MKDEQLIGFGCRVRRIRTVLGLTVEELALRAGLKVRQVVSIERGAFAFERQLLPLRFFVQRDA
ncbi:MAG TPA: hypothetical protein VK459_18305, partial [Polyangiaceae bacterium]|nr:hypothetical protein [Polyangiaceae bacterium]